MRSNMMPFSDKIDEYFFTGLNKESSICVYGSAVNGNWVSGRSDIDLIILIPQEKVGLLASQVREWSSNPDLPLLDGYSVYQTGRTLNFTNLDAYLRVNYPPAAKMELMDEWVVKNNSVQMFGKTQIKDLFPQINMNQLKAWGIDQINKLSKDQVPEGRVTLPELIWAVSWSARMMMLINGIVCESKKEALTMLGGEYPEIRELINVLLDNYDSKSKGEFNEITPEQSLFLRKFCLDLMTNAASKTLA